MKSTKRRVSRRESEMLETLEGFVIELWGKILTPKLQALHLKAQKLSRPAGKHRNTKPHEY